ncbi:MAG: hypothetical protein ACYCWW_08435 [Deltaproteobacteria bacterium]
MLEAGLIALGFGCAGPKPPLGRPCDGGPTDEYCSVWHLVCAPATASDPASCALPGEFAACAKDLGCAPGYGCEGPFPGPPPNFVCLQACAQTADCRDPDDICYPESLGRFCLPNGCGPGSAPDGGALNGTTFFAPCDALDAGDGRCVPYPSGGQVYGVCLASGAAPDGGVCSVGRWDGGEGALCAAGLGCSARDGGPGICAPLCDPSADGGCGEGLRCRPDLDPGFLAGLCWPS